jgi:hypothetical protein
MTYPIRITRRLVVYTTDGGDMPFSGHALWRYNDTPAFCWQKFEPGSNDYSFMIIRGPVIKSKARPHHLNSWNATRRLIAWIFPRPSLILTWTCLHPLISPCLIQLILKKKLLFYYPWLRHLPHHLYLALVFYLHRPPLTVSQSSQFVLWITVWTASFLCLFLSTPWFCIEYLEPVGPPFLSVAPLTHLFWPVFRPDGPSVGCLSRPRSIFH